MLYTCILLSDSDVKSWPPSSSKSSERIVFAGCGGFPGPEPDGGCLKCWMRCQIFSF
jgi:hypothetical protein